MTVVKGRVLSATGELKTHPAAAVNGLQFTNGCFLSSLCTKTDLTVIYRDKPVINPGVIGAICNNYPLLPLPPPSPPPPSRFQCSCVKAEMGLEVQYGDSATMLVYQDGRGSSLCARISALWSWRGAIKLWHTIQSRVKDFTPFPATSKLSARVLRFYLLWFFCPLFQPNYGGALHQKVLYWKGFFF